MWNTFKKKILYGGVSPEIYKMIEPDVIKSNWSNLHRFSGLVFAAMLVMLAMSFLDASLEKNRLVYIATGGCNLLIMGMSLGPCRKHPGLVKPFVHLFQLIMLWFGVMLCTVIEPNEVAVSFVIMLFVLPLLFTDRPIHVILTVLCGILMYVIFEEHALASLEDATRAYQVRGYNLTNILPYGVLSMIVSFYMTQIKVERFAYILKNKLLSETDPMTGMLNRRSYSVQLENIRETGTAGSLTVCSVDVNGLKFANDSMGHSAGDELIYGAAECIIDTLGRYGQCYRTGGDEFVVIIEDMKGATCEELRAELYSRCASWRGHMIGTLSVSAGIIRNTEGYGIDELLSRADAAMYEQKARYYETNGKTRR